MGLYKGGLQLMKTNMEGVKNTAKHLCDAVKIEPIIHGLLDCNFHKM